MHKIDKQTAVLQAKDLLEKVGLADRADYYPNELSGGQQQRVALARALALNPKLLLLDEPTSALDPEMIGEVLSVIKRFNDGTRTMIIVSHEMGFLADIADKILFLESGLVQAEGSPEEVFGGHRSERLNRFLSRVRWSDHAPTNRKKEVLDD